MGNGTSAGLTTQDITSLRKGTPFTYEEVTFLLKRYSNFDSSPGGSTGISCLECAQMPEFSSNPFASAVIESLKDSNTSKIHPRQFLEICSIFSPRTDARGKKEKLFKLFDKEDKNVLRHDHMFRLYKTLFGNAMSDDHILALTFHFLGNPSLANEGEITLAEFSKMVTDSEMTEKFTIEFSPS
ncbi:hypothetical protein ACJMK2_027634 [Sinanodonta woodiana]|uniref:Uncharacterized protein n=1 Tax=Sinanodonta woodiana TaxID=1069815 RepID=A0ABD3X4J5_SINWO